MARIDYDDAAAAAFETARKLPSEGLASWRAAIHKHLAPHRGMHVVDVGSGTGTWAAALTGWYEISVVAVEPSAAMRARSEFPNTVGGHAGALPIRGHSMDGAWLSTVVHHIADLRAAAHELARVLRPDAPVLIRAAFPGRYQHIRLVRHWPETAAVLDTYPSIQAVCEDFEAAGFAFEAVEAVPQITAVSTIALAATLSREAHTPLMLIDDRAYEAGLARLHAAAATEHGPVVDSLDLLVLRNGPAK